MAKYIKGQHLSELKKQQQKQLVFWTLGNAPTQQAHNLEYRAVLNNLKLLYLLSGKIIASSSYFFESPITQSVTDSLKDFFDDGSILYFFDDDLESPTDHVKKKISKSPKGLSAYSNEQKVLSEAKKLEGFNNNLLRRPNTSISDKIVELWISDILSLEDYTIGAYISKELKSIEKQSSTKKSSLILLKIEKRILCGNILSLF
jgi:hypothetical protein